MKIREIDQRKLKDFVLLSLSYEKMELFIVSIDVLKTDDSFKHCNLESCARSHSRLAFKYTDINKCSSKNK